MKVNIITEGGHKYGLGHVTRCFALHQEFVKRGISPELIIQGDDELRDIVTNGKYQTFDWMAAKDRLFTIVDKADIIVIDSYLANRKFYEEISKRAATLAYIDDNARIEYPRGIVVNGSLNAGHLPYPRSKGRKYLLGPQYA
ncbi:MAG: UDP-2,4-diacetamido-2,4,6-trideoxy-beta-L-altropyranose hydrolase, partial [Candidatus Omnitrophica bacterium]|nr:UDP-2,4-diacetamido-2,4,6-trideoxy-beta-L-altropyranose hydrolase [Candidatus Omnitrophota bacterium]